MKRLFVKAKEYNKGERVCAGYSELFPVSTLYHYASQRLAFRICLEETRNANIFLMRKVTHAYGTRTE